MSTPPAPGRRVSRTWAVDPAALKGFDLIGWAGANGWLYRSPIVTLAGRGVAARLELDGGLCARAAREAIRRELSEITSNDKCGEPVPGPIAMGALPFDSAATASLVVPDRLIGFRCDGAAWVTAVGPAGAEQPTSWEEIVAPAPEPEEARTCFEEPDSFSLVPVPGHSDWMERVGEAVEVVRAGELEKLVLSRTVIVEANRPIVVTEVLRRLAVLYPSCTVFSFGGFVGASPELLVRKSGREVTSFPLAGTVPHSGDPATDAAAERHMLVSRKERHEHEVAVREVTDRLGVVCDRIEAPDSPSIVTLRNVSHLGTEISGTLRDSGASEADPTVVDLAALLHPTPAVAGNPLEASLQWIAKLESVPRGQYAGPVGWMDAGGNGEFVVGIRSGRIDGAHATLHAGVGVVADSDPARELAETQLKLQALLAALVRP